MIDESMSYRYVRAASIAPAGLVNIGPSFFTRGYLLVQWVGVRHGRITPVVIIPNQIEPAANLEPRTKTSAERRVCVVDA